MGLRETNPASAPQARLPSHTSSLAQRRAASEGRQPHLEERLLVKWDNFEHKTKERMPLIEIYRGLKTLEMIIFPIQNMKQNKKERKKEKEISLPHCRVPLPCETSKLTPHWKDTRPQSHYLEIWPLCIHLAFTVWICI